MKEYPYIPHIIEYTEINTKIKSKTKGKIDKTQPMSSKQVSINDRQFLKGIVQVTITNATMDYV